MIGKFIVIEGGEGAGKDANIELLKKDFNGENFVWVKDPGGTPVGDQLRAMVQHGENIAKQTELFLFMAARAQLTHEVILPALESGKHVISNRFDLSTMAYQVYGRERQDLKDVLMQMSRLAMEGVSPDLLILLDIDPREGLKRAAQRKERTTRFEAEEISFHTRVREGYRTHAGDYKKSAIIDASRPLPKVYIDVKREVEALLSNTSTTTKV